MRVTDTIRSYVLNIYQPGPEFDRIDEMSASHTEYFRYSGKEQEMTIIL